MSTEQVMSFDERWDAWQARGRAADVRVARRMRVVAFVIAVAVMAALSWALFH